METDLTKIRIAGEQQLQLKENMRKLSSAHRASASCQRIVPVTLASQNSCGARWLCSAMSFRPAFQ